MKRWTLLILALLFASAAPAERIKDLAAIQGVRSNQLVGYGLVVGLDGTGDHPLHVGRAGHPHPG